MRPVDIGDQIVFRSRPDRPQRRGVIIELLGPADREHLRVRWDDGSVSIFSPDGTGVLPPSTPREGEFDLEPAVLVG